MIWVKRKTDFSLNSESLFQSSLLERFIRCMARLGPFIDREVPVGQRAEPDLMIAFAHPNKGAAVLRQDLFELAQKAGHRSNPDQASGLGMRAR